MNTAHPLSRRSFLQTGDSAYASIQFLPGRVLGLDGQQPANSRLNLAGVGIGGQGNSDIGQFPDDNVQRRFTNSETAHGFLRREYRTGWAI